MDRKKEGREKQMANVELGKRGKFVLIMAK
jgi:hypothetical protein